VARQTDIVSPFLLPLFERVVVGQVGVEEGGLVVAQRVRGAQEVLARPDLAKGIERKSVLIERKARADDVQEAALVKVHDELLVRHDETAFEPAGRMQHEVRAGEERRPERVGAFGRRLGVRELRSAQVSSAAQRHAEASRQLADGEVRQRRFRGAESRGAAAQRHRREKLPRIAGDPGRSSCPSATQKSASAKHCARPPAVVTGPIAPPRMKGTQTGA
jgi:hypothetical protein